MEMMIEARELDVVVERFKDKSKKKDSHNS